MTRQHPFPDKVRPAKLRPSDPTPVPTIADASSPAPKDDQLQAKLATVSASGAKAGADPVDPQASSNSAISKNNASKVCAYHLKNNINFVVCDMHASFRSNFEFIFTWSIAGKHIAT